MLGFLPTRAYRPGTPGATTFLSPLSGTFNYGWDSFQVSGYFSQTIPSTKTPIMKTVSGFEVTGWDAMPYGEEGEGPFLSEAHVVKRYHGDLDGEGRVSC